MAKQAPLVLISVLSSASAVLRFLPIGIATGLLGALVSFKPIRNAAFKTRVMEYNLSIAFPELDKTAVKVLVKQIAANMGRMIGEMIHIKAFKDGKRGTSIKITTPDGLPFDTTTSAIFVSVHAGSWELLPLAFKENAHNFTIIYTDDKNATINRFLNSMRSSTGGTYVEKAKSVKACLSTLEKGGAVGLLVDQRVDTGLEVEFFGRTSLVSRFPASLAMRYSRPIIPFEAIRLGTGKLEFIFHPPISPDGRSGKEAEIAMTQNMAESIQDILTRNKQTWFCNKRRWKRPNKELTSRVPCDPVAVDANHV